MKTNEKKTVKPNDGITKKEKADLKKIAAQVAIDHKGAKKPQPLQPMKGDDIITLCTIPVVKWVVDEKPDELTAKGPIRLTFYNPRRIVTSCTVQAKASVVKKIRDTCDNKEDLIVRWVRMFCGKEIYEQTYSNVSEGGAIRIAQKKIMRHLEELGVKLEYEPDLYSKQEIMDYIFQWSSLLRETRDWMRKIGAYAQLLKDPIYVLPDMEKFTIKDGKFVPIEKPEPIKKSPKK